jgi:hypothetical protein
MTPDCGPCGEGEQCADGVCTSCADGGNPCPAGFCGQTTDACGNPVTCNCPADPHWACVGNQCVCTPDTCGTPGRECGTFPDNGCGSPLNCSPTCPADGGALVCADFNCRNFTCSGGTCVCSPDPCPSGGNLCGDGCGDLVPCSCGGDLLYDRCAAGACTCAFDGWEPNDTWSTSRPFADPAKALTDPANTFEAAADRCVTVTPNMPTGNRDWFALRLTEPATSDPFVRVRLSGIPAGANYDLAAVWRCDSGQPANCRPSNFNVTCQQGSVPAILQFQGAGDLCACLANQSGSVEEVIANMRLTCAGAPRTGTLYLLVDPITAASPPTCGRYFLGVKVSRSAISESCP